MTHPKKPEVFVTRKLPAPVEARMQELFSVTLNRDDRPLSRDELADAMARADVLVPTLTDRIDKTLIEQAGPRLKLIASFSNGVDNVDVNAAAKKGITVTNTPNVLTEDTADMTMALVLAVPRRLAEGAGFLSRAEPGQWQGWSPTWMLGRRIWGKRIGIVGMGRIGTAVAIGIKRKDREADGPVDVVAGTAVGRVVAVCRVARPKQLRMGRRERAGKHAEREVGESAAARALKRRAHRVLASSSEDVKHRVVALARVV